MPQPIRHLPLKFYNILKELCNSKYLVQQYLCDLE